MGNRFVTTIRRSAVALMFAAGLVSGVGNATLIDRGGGLIYDTDRNITWLKDANYAMTQYAATGGALGDADGRMTWVNAVAWASDLVYGGYSDWRLPTTPQPDLSCGTQFGGFSSGFNCTGSEMGHLFYVEGGLSAGASIVTSTILDDYFTNMVPGISINYWSGTFFPGPCSSAICAYTFGTSEGSSSAAQGDSGSGVEFYAWAVRNGDVAAVPEPISLALLGLGLAGLGYSRRKKA